METLLRAAVLLKPVDSSAGQKLSSQGTDLLRKHPEVPRDRTIVNSLFSLDPQNAESTVLAGTDRVNAYNELMRYSLLRGQWDQAAGALRKALGDGAVEDHVEDLWGTSTIEKLVSADPKTAAALFVELFAASRSERARAKLPDCFSNLLVSFGDAAPARGPEIRDALLLLLPIIGDVTAPAAQLPGRQFTVGSQVVQVRNGQERLLLRFGAFLHALAPETYRTTGDLFGQWDSALASVNTLQEAAALPGSPVGPALAARPAPPPDFTTALADVQKNLADVQKNTAQSYIRLIRRADTPPEQRIAVIPLAVKAVQSISTPSDALDMAESLLDAADDVAWTDRSVIKPVAAELLNAIQKAGRYPGDYAWIASEEREAKFVLDSDDPCCWRCAPSSTWRRPPFRVTISP